MIKEPPSSRPNRSARLSSRSSPRAHSAVSGIQICALNRSCGPYFPTSISSSGSASSSSMASGRRCDRGDPLGQQADLAQDVREMGPLLVGDRQQRATDIRRLEDTKDAETFLQSNAVVADRCVDNHIAEPL